MTEKNERYYYHDFGEYCTITDTKEHPKTLNDFYNKLVNDGYLEDYDGDKEVVLELAEEKYHDYLADNCLSPIEVIRRLNEQEERINELELENAKHIGDGEWDIRDITYGHGKFRLEEWGERYHQFYDGDNPLEDETVVSLLFENDKLKQQIETKNQQIKKLETENEWLKQSNKNLGKITYPTQRYFNGDVE